MSIEPTLFGGEALVRNCRRIGVRGRYRMDLFEDKATAQTAMARLAWIKCRRGYFPVPVSGSHSLSPAISDSRSFNLIEIHLYRAGPARGQGAVRTGTPTLFSRPPSGRMCGPGRWGLRTVPPMPESSAMEAGS
jgi:predicted DNA-binding WGR domain protein